MMCGKIIIACCRVYITAKSTYTIIHTKFFKQNVIQYLFYEYSAMDLCNDIFFLYFVSCLINNSSANKKINKIIKKKIHKTRNNLLLTTSLCVSFQLKSTTNVRVTTLSTPNKKMRLKILKILFVNFFNCNYDDHQ